MKSSLQLKGRECYIEHKFTIRKIGVKWNDTYSALSCLRAKTGNLGDNTYVLGGSVETAHIHPLFNLGGDKELGCFNDILPREVKRGNKGVNKKTSDTKCLFTLCESLILFCFKNMLGIHLIFLRAHPLP